MRFRHMKVTSRVQKKDIPPAPPNVLQSLKILELRCKKRSSHSQQQETMKRTHISYSLDRTCMILLITLALLSLILLLIIGQNKSSPSTDTSSNQQKHSILDQNLNDPSQLPRLPRFAYFISGTKGDVSSVKRLLQAVYHPRNYYLLHLDFEASEGERLELAKYVKVESGVMREFGNVMVLGKGDLVTYKGPTMIASILHGVAILLKQFEDWDWFVNLSAEDYPLMSQDGNFLNFRFAFLVFLA